MNAAAVIRHSTTKGENTRFAILAAAVEQASAAGFESLTIGTLAEKTGMSKSGLFAHFGSKLELQMAALDEAARQFTEAVFLPAMKAPRGLRRFQALFENWITWPQRASLPGGCPIDAASRIDGGQCGPQGRSVPVNIRQDGDPGSHGRTPPQPFTFSRMCCPS
jgi:AcrR family transcriptional regulator